MANKPPFTSPEATERRRRARAVLRLVQAALDLDAAFDLRRAFEDAAVTRDFVLACRIVRDLERDGDLESGAT